MVCVTVINYYYYGRLLPLPPLLCLTPTVLATVWNSPCSTIQSLSLASDSLRTPRRGRTG
jgi:hypothetical protein